MLYSDKPPEELARYPGFLMGFLGERSRSRMLELLEPLGFHPRELGLMSVVAARPGITQHELAALARVDPSTMVALLDDFEERGLAERRVDPDDRRRRAVHLTAEGRAALQRLRRVAAAWSADFLAPLDAEEGATLLKLLRKLAGVEDGD